MSGSPEPLQLGLALKLVCVIDTGIMINFKRSVGINDQWALLTRMTGLVETGEIAFPRQVVRELVEDFKYPDAPGAWISNAKNYVRYRDPSELTLSKVLAVAQLVEADATKDIADPYVVAMACEIAEQPECRPVVATDDVVDRMPTKEALKTACDRLGIECWTCEELVAWVRAAMPQS
jgi:Domain of unknown function (DUF4411)